MKSIEGSVSSIAQKVNVASTSIESQASALEEINSSVEKLTSVARIQEELSKKL